ncbi:MAG: hypothetical protein KKC76_18885 [Proteobacteria bacterium]|nr:hypothetical protein [Pseudomonadota bacterium]MBU4296512.1 hypothetical protein [Pseudomonadota bacterium]MCG2746893.1 hypothetical protein [Desulfobulbaceae bacterium]
MSPKFALAAERKKPRPLKSKVRQMGMSLGNEGGEMRRASLFTAPNGWPHEAVLTLLTMIPISDWGNITLKGAKESWFLSAV